MSIPGAANPLLLATAAAGGYEISRSLRFNSSDSAYLSRTPSSSGNRRTWTWAGWVKRSKLGSNTENHHLMRVNANVETAVRIKDDNVLEVYSLASGTYGIQIRTSALLRDLSAWYHVVFSVDTTQASSADRVKLYLNGVQLTSFSISTYPSQNYDTGFNQAVAHAIGASPTPSEYFNGYLADIHFIDGQALTPSSFTEVSATTGQLIPKAYTGSFGTNGFWLKFSDNSNNTAATLGKDYSGNGHNWTPTNLSVTAGAGNDSLVDTPTSYGTDTGAGGEVRGNYATLNPLAKGSAITLANGNLDWSESASDAKVLGTIGMSSGKWYWEVTCTATNQHMGLATQAANLNAAVGYDAFSWSYGSSSGQKVTNSSGSAYGATYTTGDVIGVAFDADNGTLTFYKNGTSQGQAFSGLTSGPYFAAVGNASTSGSINFGQRPFAYQTAGTNRPASTYLALCDQNLPTPVVAKPSTVMDVALWTGNGSARSITGLGFNPDLVWIKGRSGATDHALYDVVRGAEKRLESNATDAEVTSDGGVTAFNSDGFSLGTLAQVNTNSATYAGWAWDAGTTTSSNGSGSITGTVSVRANTSAGFSVVTYTGNGSNSTVGHGLGVAPQLIIVKRRNSTGDWATWHTSIANTNYLLLNSTAASTSGTTYWNSTSPTSSVFSVGTATNTNANTGTYVAYCFAPVAGYSAMGSFVGNGSTDGVFVYTGHRSRWLMIKRTDTTSQWSIWDTARNPYNVSGTNLWADSSEVEVTSVNYNADFLSNGFKMRTDSPARNGSGGTYIYISFAESPFAYSRAR